MVYGYTGREMSLSIEDSLNYIYIQEVTGLEASINPIAFMDKNAPAGHYAIFFTNKFGEGHVLYGRISQSGKKFIYGK